MTAPVWKANGTVQTAAPGALTVPWPAGHAVGDLAILAITTQAASGVAQPTLTSAQGFVWFGSSVDSSADIRIDVFWCIATSTSMSSPVVASVASTAQLARILTYSGANQTTAPLVCQTTSGLGATSSIWPAASTPIAQCLLVFFLGHNADAAGNATNVNVDFTNANLSTISEHEADVAAGFGLSTACSQAEMDANFVGGPGNFGASSWSFTVSGHNYADITIAIEPPFTASGGPPPRALHQLPAPWQSPGMFRRPPSAAGGIVDTPALPQSTAPPAGQHPSLREMVQMAPWVTPGMFARPKSYSGPPVDNNPPPPLPLVGIVPHLRELTQAPWLRPGMFARPPSYSGGVVDNNPPVAPPIIPPTVPPGVGIDHVSAALNRLAEQFKNQPNIAAFLTALVGPCQPLENALQQLYTQRTIFTAIGVQLDALGSLVGQPRNGLVDADYRRFILARISTNNSDGRVEDLITVAKLVLNTAGVTITVLPQGTATVVVAIGAVAIAFALGSILSTFMQAAVAAGVRLLTEASASSPGQTFTLDIGPGLDVGHLAYAI